MEELKLQKGEGTDGLPSGRQRVECQLWPEAREASWAEQGEGMTLGILLGWGREGMAAVGVVGVESMQGHQ